MAPKRATKSTFIPYFYEVFVPMLLTTPGIQYEKPNADDVDEKWVELLPINVTSKHPDSLQESASGGLG